MLFRSKSQNLELQFATLPVQTGVTFAQFVENVLSEQIKNSHTIRYKKNYIVLEEIFRDYFTNTGFTSYDFVDVYNFVDTMSPYWSNVLDQIIPATTLWLGGNLIENNILGRPKYQYKFPCQPTEFIDNLYPDFETAIEEDLETILGEPQNLRGLIKFSGVTYTLTIDIDGVEYNGNTQVVLTGSTLFTPYPFTPGAECTLIPNPSNYIPLICDYKDWLEPDIVEIKQQWLDALSDLVDQINTTYTGYTAGCIPDYEPYSAITSGATCTGYTQILSYEIFTDSTGTEKIRFYSYKTGTGECTIKNYVDFFFSAEYMFPEVTCELEVHVSAPCDVYPEGTEDCKLKSDV